MSPGTPSSEKRRRFAQVILALAGLPVLCFFLIFDVRDPARKFDEEYNGPKQVALGPRPRYVWCQPSYDTHYDGTEWPFRVFGSFCAVWRACTGYAPPQHSAQHSQATALVCVTCSTLAALFLLRGTDCSAG
jgi:hypothetical protein